MMNRECEQTITSTGNTRSAGRRARTAFSSAATASEDFIRESIEPQILIQ
jgi:hypothetical protein